MVVAFNEVPTSLRVPLFYAEINAGGSVLNINSRVLLIGQKQATGTATIETPYLISSNVEDELFGCKSMLAAQVRAARTAAPFAEIWAIAAADGTGATAATATIDLTTLALPLTLAATFNIYVGGRRYRTTVSTADTAITIGASLAAEINDDDCAQWTATDNADGTVTLTAITPGELANSINIRTGLYGFEPKFADAVTITAFAGGATDPDVANSIAALGEDEFDWIVMPYADTVNLDYMEDFMSNSAGRWNPLQQTYGHVFSIKPETVGNLSTLGLTRNDAHMTVLGIEVGTPTPCWEVISSIGGKAQKHLSSAPELSRPLQFIDLPGMIPAPIGERFSRVDKNTLLFDGISVLGVDAGGNMTIERLITTYRKNAAGFDDSTFLDVNMVAQSMYAIRYIRTAVSNAHGRQALAGDENPAIQGVSRPRDIKNTIISAYVQLNGLAVVEEVDLFKDLLVVERNATDANRVDVYLPMDHVNQLRIVAVNATSFQQFPQDV